MKTRLAFWLGAMGLVACAGVQELDDRAEMPRPPATATPIDPPSTPPSFTVGVSGGTFTVGELTIDVPGGAVSERIDVRIDVAPTRPDGYAIDGNVYRFTPAGLHFARPITISFPSGAERHGVHWTVDGDDSTFEPLETTVENGRVIAHPTHFSGGFVGAATTGVTCIAKRRVLAAGGCVQTTTIENDVKFTWAYTPGTDPYDAIGTSSSGVRAYYLGPPGAPIWHASDATHTKYVGYTPAKEYILRSGNVIDVYEDGARSGSPDPSCPSTIPLIDISCRGTTTIAAALPPPPPPPPADAGSDADIDAGAATDAGSDAADVDAGASTGVTCLTTRRREVCVGGVCTCEPTLTTEANVKFWLVPPSGAELTKPEGAMATSSPGLKAVYNTSLPNAPVSWATDTTYTRYEGAAFPAKEYILRTGPTIDVHIDIGRSTISIGACKSMSTIETHCSGSTTLGK